MISHSSLSTCIYVFNCQIFICIHKYDNLERERERERESILCMKEKKKTHNKHKIEKKKKCCVRENFRPTKTTESCVVIG